MAGLAAVGCGSVAGRGLPSVAGPAQNAGQVRLMRDVDPAFGRFVARATPSDRSFINANFELIRGYPPFQDQALSWSPPTTAYQDLYAIYNDRRGVPERPDLATLEAHPDWVLRDAAGSPLYIQFACGGSSCTQFAADPGNPEWRADFIRRAKLHLAAGYAGIYLDDVNLEIRVSDGSGQQVIPIDPRTGAAITLADWRRYIAEFTEQIRSELLADYPDALIEQNPLWFLDQADPFVVRQTEAADYVQLERGFNDPGLRAGEGVYSFSRYLAHIDWLHSLGKAVVYKPDRLDGVSRQFELAAYLLVNTGHDLICPRDYADPDLLWAGWKTDLGAALGPRWFEDGLWRRDFVGGTIYLHPPDQAGPISRRLAAEMVDPDGLRHDRITLAPRTAAVLRKP